MIEELIYDLSKSPFSPPKNFAVAAEYERQNQSASAVSFYLRTAEFGRTSHPLLVYTSLIKLAHCFEDQNDRMATVSNALLQAVSYEPGRREAYFFLAQFCERAQQWQECMTWTSLGLAQPEREPLPLDVGYKTYGLLFERAVCAYWLGRRDISRELFNHLLELDLTPEYRSSVEDNLRRLDAVL